jgi:hypothetical protein
MYVVLGRKLLCMTTIHLTWRLKNRIAVKQFTKFSNMNCKNFPKIYLKEFRHVSQQRVGILKLNIIYDDEYDISYCI